MQRQLKIGIALLLLAGGLGAAMLFRHREAADEQPEAAPADEVLVLRDNPQQPAPEPRLSEPTSREEEPPREEETHVPPAVATSRAPQPQSIEQERPPEFASRYAPVLPSSIEEFAAKKDGAQRTVVQGETPTVMSREIPRAQAQVRSHRIADGDTLSSIAKRYLNDAGRYREVFEANRDQLQDPDVLPIGVQLKIPPLEVPPTAEDATGAEEEGLVPVPRAVLRGD